MTNWFIAGLSGDFFPIIRGGHPTKDATKSGATFKVWDPTVPVMKFGLDWFNFVVEHLTDTLGFEVGVLVGCVHLPRITNHSRRISGENCRSEFHGYVQRSHKVEPQT